MNDKSVLAIADALEHLAAVLRRGVDGETARVTPPNQGPWEPDAAVAHARALHPALGTQQERIIRLLAHAHPEGLTARQMTDIPTSAPNTYITLDKLRELGLVTRQEGATPRRYFLGLRMGGEDTDA